MDPTPPFDRREFLKRGLQACALTSSAAMASLALARCAPNASSHPTTTELVPRPLTTLEWRRLGHSMTGALVLPSSPTYPTDRLLYNSKFSNLHPAAIAYCANTEDVVRCIDFVASHGIEVCARSRGAQLWRLLRLQRARCRRESSQFGNGRLESQRRHRGCGRAID